MLMLVQEVSRSWSVFARGERRGARRWKEVEVGWMVLARSLELKSGQAAALLFGHRRIKVTMLQFTPEPRGDWAAQQGHRKYNLIASRPQHRTGMVWRASGSERSRQGRKGQATCVHLLVPLVLCHVWLKIAGPASCQTADSRSLVDAKLGTGFTFPGELGGVSILHAA